MNGEWRRILWHRTAHLVNADGRVMCGYGRCLPEQWAPAGDARRCLRCRWCSGDRTGQAPYGHARRRRAVLAAGAFAGPDPLAAAIRAYQGEVPA